MRVVALEASLVLGSVAAYDAETLLAEISLDPRVRTARSLAPGVQQLLRQVGWRPGDVQLVATSIGPGSFTGVRVALATAKALAYAWKVPVVGIDTLHAIAAQAPGDAETIFAAIDAQRRQLFVERFRRVAGDLKALGPPQVLDNASFMETLASAPAGTLVTGPGLERLRDLLPATVAVAEPSQWNPTAATVGQLAWRAVRAGRTATWRELAPLYLRPSAAEEAARGQ